MVVSTVFLLLIIWSVGIFWAKYFPKASWVEGTRLAWLAPALDFINPGEFRIKEVSRAIVLWRFHRFLTCNVACYCFISRVYCSCWQ